MASCQKLRKQEDKSIIIKEAAGKAIAWSTNHTTYSRDWNCTPKANSSIGPLPQPPLMLQFNGKGLPQPCLLLAWSQRYISSFACPHPPSHEISCIAQFWSLCILWYIWPAPMAWSGTGHGKCSPPVHFTLWHNDWCLPYKNCTKPLTQPNNITHYSTKSQSLHQWCSATCHNW